jgi:hypothetical protein
MNPEGTHSSQPRDIEFAIDPRRVLRVLLIVTAVLVVLSTLGQATVYYLPDFPLHDGIANLLYVDMEQNPSTLYSTLMLLVAALLFGVIAQAHGRGDRAYVRHWAALSVAFVLLAFDEFLSIHERFIRPFRELLSIEGGPLFFAWVVPGGALVAVFGITFLRFVKHLPRPARRRLVAAGILFVSGAIGFEMVGASYSAVHGQLNMGLVVIVTVEETLEMVGAAVLLYGLLAYIPVILPDAGWRLRVNAVD